MMRYGTGVLFFILVFAAFTGVVVWKNQMAAYLGRITGLNICGDVAAVRLENEVFRERLNALTATSSEPVAAGARVAFIHAAYPFNNSNRISIDKGAAEGVGLFMPATVGGTIFIGQVVSVFKQYSIVRTVFSPDWQVPVRIGPRKIPGLLQGGPVVRVFMIDNDKTIYAGDSIITAGREMPFGLKIGVIDAIRSDTTAGVFQEATVLFSYALTDLTELTLLPWTSE